MKTTNVWKDYDSEHDVHVAWGDAKIIFSAREKKWCQRKWKEACLIEETNNAIANRDILPEVYKLLITK